MVKYFKIVGWTFKYELFLYQKICEGGKPGCQ